MKKKILSFFIMCLITLVTLELGSAILLRTDMLHGDLPTYRFSQSLERFWTELDPTFGVWHTPNSQYRHHKSCFDVEYQANSFGMRDKERRLVSDKKRVVVLGDSLIEGYGVPEEQRITNLLEKDSGTEYLNFGTAGSFGPTQYYLLYKTLAKKFDHQEVIIGIYPKNDFSDDNIDEWKDKDRYRPFWVGEYPNYELVYTKPFNLGKYDRSRYISEMLQDATHLYSAVTYLARLRRYKLNSYQVAPNGEVFSGFYDFSEADFNRLRFSLEKIVEEAGGRPVTLLLIPAPADFVRYDKYGPSPLEKKMEEFAKSHSIKLISLLSEMHQKTKQWDKYFFTCDDHLSEYGDRVAFEIIKKETQKNQYSTKN